LSFAERGWSDPMHSRTVPFLSHNLHDKVPLTTCFAPEIVLTHSEIWGAQ